MAQVGAGIIAVASVLVMVLAVAAMTQQRLFSCSATVEEVMRPGLYADVGGLSAREPMTPGRLLEEGITMIAEPGAAARVALCSTGVLRIESSGRWRLAELRRSRNGRLSRMVIDQERGTMSVVSAPPKAGRRSQMIVRLPHGRIELSGAATITTRPDGQSVVQILQGRCLALDGARRVELGAGDMIEFP